MTESLRIEDFRVEPVKQDARYLKSRDFKMVGQANASTPLLRAAFETRQMTNLAFVENGERMTFPAFVTFFDESHGVVTAIVKPAGAPEPA